MFLVVALYWVSEWWIPFLVAKDKIPDYKSDDSTDVTVK